LEVLNEALKPPEEDGHEAAAMGEGASTEGDMGKFKAKNKVGKPKQVLTTEEKEEAKAKREAKKRMEALAKEERKEARAKKKAEKEKELLKKEERKEEREKKKLAKQTAANELRKIKMGVSDEEVEEEDEELGEMSNWGGGNVKGLGVQV
jgi:hypothetical protein